MIPSPPTPRRGIAIVWVLVVLAVVTAFSVAVAARFLAARRQLDMANNRVQAEWLAASGCELAAARLLADPDGYAGENATLIPGGDVKVSVKRDPQAKGVYQVESEARFTAYPGVVAATARRTVKLTGGGRIEVAPGSP